MERDEDLPAALTDALRAAAPNAPQITARADRQIEALAHAHFASRARPARRRHLAFAALAATLLVAVTLATLTTRSPDPSELLFTDVDGSGRIDIADVLALARESSTVTQQQLDAFAMSIVTLDPADDRS